MVGYIELCNCVIGSMDYPTKEIYHMELDRINCPIGVCNFFI